MPAHKIPIDVRFWSKVDRRGPDECWPWMGNLHDAGYGMLWRTNTTRYRAHRVAYELLVGPIPAGLDIDHTCHNRDAACLGGRTCLHRRCVNPAHLEPVSNAVNARRGRAGVVNGGREAAKTHCVAGHPFDEVNTADYRGKGWRDCRACARERMRRKRAAQAT